MTRSRLTRPAVSRLARPVIDTSGASFDTDAATTRYLLYGLLPSWFVPGVADQALHRRTKTEETTSTRESVIHCLMMAETGLPLALTLLCGVNPLLLTVMIGATGAHEVTALYDVRTAARSDRGLKPIEQHVHSFLEALPFGAPAALMCLHGEQVRSLLHGGRGDPTAWRLAPRPKRVPVPCLAGTGAGVVCAVVLPYAEELRRCVRASRRRREEEKKGLAG